MEMEAYLDGRRHEGALDSEGSFTLDRLSALRMTLTSALPSPHFYLLQTCQGLLTGGATDLEVAVGRASIRIDFVDSKQAFVDLDGFVSRLSSGLTLSSPSPVDLLLTGMVTGLGSGMERAELYSAGSDTLFWMSADAVEASPQSPVQGPTRGRDSVTFRRLAGQGLSFAWTRLWGGKDEESVLQEHFGCSNPGIKVAGLLTSPSYPFEIRDLEEVFDHPVMLEAAVLASKGSPGLHRAFAFDSMGCYFRKAFDEQGLPVTISLEQDDWDRRLWTFYFKAGSDGAATVRWIRNGCFLTPTRHDLGIPGLTVLAPAEGLDVDASGYSVVANEKLETVLEKARSLVVSLRASLSVEEVKDFVTRGLTQRAKSSARPLSPERGMEAIFEAYPWLLTET